MTEPILSVTSPLAGVVPVSLWLEQEDVAGVFATAAAWNWFRKEHLPELVERGALLLGAGRRGDMVTCQTAAVVKEILLRESIERLRRQANSRTIAGIAGIAARQADNVTA